MVAKQLANSPIHNLVFLKMHCPPKHHANHQDTEDKHLFVYEQKLVSCSIWILYSM